MSKISAKYLPFLSQFIAKQDVRYYLNGLLIEKAKKGAFLVATDGHRLAVIHDESAIVSATTLVPIDRLLIANAKKAETVRFDSEIASLLKEDESLILSVGCKPIDGKFPDWRAVIPKELDPTPAAINAEYVSQLKLAPTTSSYSDKPFVAHYAGKNKPVIIRFPDAAEILVLIMPMCCTEIAAIPEWLELEKPEKRKKAAKKTTAKKTTAKKVKP